MVPGLANKSQIKTQNKADIMNSVTRKNSRLPYCYNTNIE